ncbi:hypothetical protein BgiBS90_025734, partial [Biomphalaria glabrata]
LIEYKAKTNHTREDVTSDLNDDDETTCISLNMDGLIVDLKRSYYNPWIRLSTQKPEYLYSLKISYMKKDRKHVLANSKENIVVRDNTLDVYISIDAVYIRYIIIKSEAVQRLCSLWVNIGQNVVTKQNVYYSNSKINQIDTNLPQYPQATNGVRDCDRKDTDIVGTNWEIIMSHALFIKEYIFFVNNTHRESRYFTLERFDNNGELYKTYTSPRLPSNPTYHFTTSNNTLTKAFTCSLTIASTNRSIALLLCEVEGYA